MKKFKTLAEVYQTGVTHQSQPYEQTYIDSPRSFINLTEAYRNVYTESQMAIPNFGQGSVNWNKYRARLKELVKSDDNEIHIHSSHFNRYGIQQFNSSMIVNKKEVIDFVDNLPPGVAPPASKWPTISIKDGSSVLNINIGHLQKSGQFREEKEGQTSTDVKEGLVSLFFTLKHTDPVTKLNFEEVRKKLRAAVTEGFEGETSTALEQIGKFLGDVEDGGQKAAFRHELNQPLSQAVTILDSKYKNWQANRGKLFHDIREAAREITKFPADKWCPGDIYFINPELEDEIRDTLKKIKKSEGDTDHLSLLNGLFVSDWGETDKPILAISLKFKDAQGGKAKDFLRKFIPEGTKDKPYLLQDKDRNLTEEEVSRAITEYRSNIRDYINKKGTDVNIQYEVPNDTHDLMMNPKRLREKYASLKLIDFLFQQADPGKLDDVIVGAIGFGLSLAGVNPTFYKVVANIQGTPIDHPEKFSEKGAIALYPTEGETDPKIKIVDKNSANKVEIHSRVEIGPDEIKNVLLSARSNGGIQATLEIEKIR